MHNRVVLITGASSGIGAATARSLADSSRLVLVARREERLQALAESIQQQGGQALVCAADLTLPGEAERVVAAAVEHFGSLDVLVNNAGLFTMLMADEMQAERITPQIMLNLQVPMQLTAAAIPHLEQKGGGMLVNVSSIAAKAAFAGCGVYAATKAGLEAWTRCIREELRGRGIRVTCVAPGATDSEIWPADFQPEPYQMARAEDVAAAIAFALNCPATAAVDEITITPPSGAL